MYHIGLLQRRLVIFVSSNRRKILGAICLRFGWSNASLPTTCPCGSRFGTQHCMSFRGFVSIRNNHLRDITANMLSQVCNDIKIEAKVTPKLIGEELNSRTANTTNEERLDFRACGV